MTYTVSNLTIEDFSPPALTQADRITSLRFATRAAGIFHAVYDLPEPPTVTFDQGRYSVSVYRTEYYGYMGQRVVTPRARYSIAGGRWVYADLDARELYTWANCAYAAADTHDDWHGLCLPEDCSGFRSVSECYSWSDYDDTGWHIEPPPNDYDDDDDENSEDITGYHSERRLAPMQSYDLAVELEVFDRNKLAVSEVRYHGHIAEHDGSLDTGGYEIVQRQPRQLDAVIGEIGWQEIISKLPSQANRTGYGMHVSVNALGWTRPQETTFVAFWTANEDFVCSFSGRRYCESYAQKGDDVHTDEDVALKYARSQHRYAACSVRGGGRIEVRLFRTTRQWHIFAGRVQVVDAVARWAAGCGDTATHKFVTNILGSGGLLEWMKERQATYPYAIKLVEQWAEKEVTA